MGFYYYYYMPLAYYVSYYYYHYDIRFRASCFIQLYITHTPTTIMLILYQYTRLFHSGVRLFFINKSIAYFLLSFIFALFILCICICCCMEMGERKYDDEPYEGEVVVHQEVVVEHHHGVPPPGPYPYGE